MSASLGANELAQQQINGLLAAREAAFIGPVVVNITDSSNARSVIVTDRNTHNVQDGDAPRVPPARGLGL